MHNNDIVYVVRPGDDNEELRYSLRSVAANMPHRNIVIAGYKPDWVKDVRYIPVEQTGTKYQNAMANWVAAINDDYLSEDFILFNDDFYVMQPVEYLKTFHRGRVQDVIRIYDHRGGPYVTNMKRTAKLLNQLGVTEQFSYALHIPMFMNKTKYKFLLGGIEAAGYPLEGVQMRTLYGNFWRVGGEYHDDVKVNKVDEIPDAGSVFLSSLDESFKGLVGELVRERFNKPCKYEVE